MRSSAGIRVDVPVTMKASATTLEGGTGSLTVTSTGSLTSDSQALSITVDGADIAGDVAATQIELTCTTEGLEVGLGTAVAPMSLDSGELQHFNAAGLIIGGSQCSSQTISGVEATATEQLAGILTLAATRDGSRVVFEGSPSTFAALAVQAEEYLGIAADVTNTEGDLYLDGNSDDDGSPEFPWVIVGAEVTVSAFNVLTLETSYGQIYNTGHATLKAGNGIVIRDKWQPLDSGADNKYFLVLNADSDADGDGTLTISDRNRVITSDSDMQITAWDVDNQGYAMVGKGSITIHSSFDSQTIGLGGTAGNMHITTDELRRFGATATEIGSDTNGVITVDGIDYQSSGYAGLVTLKALKAGQYVDFTSNPSTFTDGLEVYTDNGINMALNVESDGPTKLHTGNGRLTIGAGSTLETSHAEVSITTNDLELYGAIQTGTAGLHITTVDPMAIKLGSPEAPADGLQIDASELQKIAASGLTIESTDNDGIVVSDIDKSNSNGITGILTLNALTHTAIVQFQDAKSTFHSLAAQADNGVIMLEPVVTSSGSMLLNADYDLTAVGDTNNIIYFNEDRTWSAATVMTLQSPSSGMARFGLLTLEAGSGIVIEAEFRSDTDYVNAGDLWVINANTDTAEQGVLTVNSGIDVISADNRVLLTTWDLDLQGNLDAGYASVEIHGAHTGQTIGLGDTSQNMHIDGAELSRIIATQSDSSVHADNTGGLVLGGDDGGSIHVNRVTSAQSNSVTPLLTLTSSGEDASISFSGAASTFHELQAQADAGLSVSASLSTSVAALHLNGDLDDAADSDRGITINNGETITAKTVLSLEAGAQGILAVGSASLRAGTGIVLSDNLEMETASETLTIESDMDDRGDGSFTVAAEKSVMTNDCDLQVTAWDITLEGSFSAGGSAAPVSLHGSKTDHTIGLGFDDDDTDADLNRGLYLSDAELSRVSVSGDLTVGSSSILEIEVRGVASLTAISGLVTLDAGSDGGEIEFTTTASTFNTVTALAADGIGVAVNVDTIVGTLLLNADTDSSILVDGASTAMGLEISGTETTLTAETQLVLRSAPAGISRLPTTLLSLRAKEGIVIENEFVSGTDADTAQPLHINADIDADGAGTFELQTGVGLSTSNAVLTLTAADVQLDGSITTGDAVLVLQTTNMRDIGLGAAALSSGLDVNQLELQRTTAAGLVVGDDTHSTDIHLVGVTADNSNGISGIVSLLATSTWAVLHIETQSSTFGSLAILADDGIVVGADITTTTGAMFLDGVADGGSAGGDGPSTIEVADGRTVSSRTVLTLRSVDGQGIVVTNTGVGRATLEAGQGIVLLDDVSVASGSDTVELVVNADYDSDGSGVLTLVSDEVITTNGQELLLNAWDLDLSGSVTVGTSTVTLHESTDGEKVGVGVHPNSTVAGWEQRLYLSDVELGRITAAGMRVGGQYTPYVIVDGVTEGNSDAITVFSVIAQATGSQIEFYGHQSTFRALGAQAARGVTLQTDIASLEGAVLLDGDMLDEASSANPGSLSANRTVTSATVLTLHSVASTISREGSLTLVTGSGIVVLDDLTTETAPEGTAYPLVLDSDVNDAGVGQLTVTSPNIINTNNNHALVTAWDIDLAGGVNVGTDELSIHGSVNDQTLGLGKEVTTDLHIDQLEVQRIVAQHFQMGNHLNNDITVGEIYDFSTINIKHTTLLANQAERKITFTGMTNFYNGLTLQAMGGIDVQADLTVQGKANHSTTGGPGLVITAAEGTLSLSSGRTLSTSAQNLFITANDVDIQGGVTTGAQRATILILT